MEVFITEFLSFEKVQTLQFFAYFAIQFVYDVDSSNIQVRPAPKGARALFGQDRDLLPIDRHLEGVGELLTRSMGTYCTHIWPRVIFSLLYAFNFQMETIIHLDEENLIGI